jgi:hypothetical protein
VSQSHLSRYFCSQFPFRLTTNLHCQLTSSTEEIKNNIRTPIGHRPCGNGQNKTSRYGLENNACMKRESYILLSHVFTLPLCDFRCYRGKKGGTNLRLDCKSYHRLMGRLERRNTEHCIDPNHTPFSHLSSGPDVPRERIQPEGSIQDSIFGDQRLAIGRSESPPADDGGEWTQIPFRG